MSLHQRKLTIYGSFLITEKRAAEEPFCGAFFVGLTRLAAPEENKQPGAERLRLLFELYFHAVNPEFER
jgi:hypothetical protein